MSTKTILVALAAFLLILYWTSFRRSEQTPPSPDPASIGPAPQTGERQSRRTTQNPLSRGTMRDDRPGQLPAQRDEKREGPVPEEDQAAGLIFQALHADETEERAYAVSELGLLDPTPEVLSACFQALGDSASDIRLEAVLALESLEDPAALPVLRRVAEEDTSEEVKEAATEAVDSLENP